VVEPQGAQTSLAAVGRPFAVPSDPVRGEAVDVINEMTARGASLAVSDDLVPESIALQRAPATYLVRPEANEVESVRTELLRRLGVSSLTLAEQHAVSTYTTRQYRVVSALAAALIVLVAGLATMVSSYDQVRRTHRSDAC